MNRFGRLFCVTTFGESHGKALGCIVDGCPPMFALTEADIQPELDRRRPGQSRYTTQRHEADAVSILSGVFNGKTTGTPIGLLIANTDQKTKDYTAIAEIFRPAHADFTYQQKYGIRDYRGGGRASARETTMRVAAGAIAKKYLYQKYNMRIRGYLSQLGDITVAHRSWDAIAQNPFFCADMSAVPKLESYMQALIKSGDSIGAELTIVANNVPVGLGEPVFDKLDARLAYALMGINAVKAVAIGDGFAVVHQKGSKHRDEITPSGFLSNHDGGTLGGITNGQDLVLKIALKPTSSIRLPGKTININGQATSIVTKGRHDPCVGIRAVPIAEAMCALVLMDAVLIDRAYNAEQLPRDSLFD